MDRPPTPALDRPTAVRTAWTTALDLLLSTATGERRESATAPTTGRVVPGIPILWQPADGGHARSQPQAHPAADAYSGNRSSLSETGFKPSGARPRDLSLPAARRLHRKAQPGLEHRYYLYSDVWWLPLPGRRHGLVQPLRAQLGTFQYDGDRLLSGRARSGVPASANPKSGTPIRVPSSPRPISWRR